MPDLHELLAGEAERLTPGPPPPFSELRDRARRGHRAKTVGALGASIAAVTAIAVGVPHALGGSHQHRTAAAVRPTGYVGHDFGSDPVTVVALWWLNDRGGADPDFAGAYADTEHRTLIVDRKGGGASVLYPSSVSGIPVTIRSTLLSLTEMRETIDAIGAVFPQLALAGIKVMGVEASDDGPMQVHVEDPSPWMLDEVAKYAPHGASSIQIVGPNNVHVNPLIVPALTACTDQLFDTAALRERDVYAVLLPEVLRLYAIRSGDTVYLVDHGAASTNGPPLSPAVLNCLASGELGSLPPMTIVSGADDPQIKRTVPDGFSAITNGRLLTVDAVPAGGDTVRIRASTDGGGGLSASFATWTLERQRDGSWKVANVTDRGMA